MSAELQLELGSDPAAGVRRSAIITAVRHVCQLAGPTEDDSAETAVPRDDGILVRLACTCCGGEFWARVSTASERSAEKARGRVRPPTWWCPRWTTLESATNPPPDAESTLPVCP